ncbi:MAG: 50S ribosomal protein L4, partial [Tannerella forsythia]
ENSIMVLEDFTMDTPKTKDFLSMLKVLKLDGKKMLLILPESNHFVSLSARNLPRAKVIAASDLNTYKVMDAANLVFTEQSVAVIEKLLNA